MPEHYKTYSLSVNVVATTTNSKPKQKDAAFTLDDSSGAIAQVQLSGPFEGLVVFLFTAAAAAGRIKSCT